MRLPAEHLDLIQKLLEFDSWVTPSLGEISDSVKFKKELSKIVGIFDILQKATNSFESEKLCSPQNIAKIFSKLISQKNNVEKETLLADLALTLFLVTGQSDNNFKCQFPLYLRDVAGFDSIPQMRRQNKKVSKESLPRIIKSTDYMKLIANIKLKDNGIILLEKVISFLLNSKNSSNQLWSIGKSYALLKEFNRQESLLTPLVIFKIKGSVTESVGHKPEDRLRILLTEWGLQAGKDFNTTDVVVVKSSGESSQKKNRAFDFVLPYRTEGWPENWRRRLFIQCQYYAGDSGSVSHKVVDQTQNSRSTIKSEIPDAIFMEYLDGAGYFSSLNGDLRKMLALGDTNSFFQVRTSPIRLRRALQELGFITPIEIEHAILLSDGSIKKISKFLESNKYRKKEIQRAIADAVSRNIICCNKGILTIHKNRTEIVRKYAILDIAAIYGNEIKLNTNSNISGYFLVPGYGPFYGLSLDKLVSKSIEIFPALSYELSNTQIFMHDVKQLCKEGHAISR